jgi:hypothetical protein
LAAGWLHTDGSVSERIERASRLLPLLEAALQIEGISGGLPLMIAVTGDDVRQVFPRVDGYEG